MKLSAVEGERAFTIIDDLIPLVASITDDPDAAALFKREPLPDGMTGKQYSANWVRNAAQKLIKTHKQDMIKICALIEGRTEEEYMSDLTLLKLINDAVDLQSDDLFHDLFFS